MCLDSDSIERLHEASSRLRELHQARDAWRQIFSPAEDEKERITASVLLLSQAEGDRIFNARISSVESELEELGWRRTIRVDAEKRQQPAEEVA